MKAMKDTKAMKATKAMKGTSGTKGTKAMKGTKDKKAKTPVRRLVVFDSDDSEASYCSETNTFEGYSKVNVGGGEKPQIEQIQCKTGSKIWCTYNGKTYYQIAGKGKPNEWKEYVWPKKYDKLVFKSEKSSSSKAAKEE